MRLVIPFLLLSVYWLAGCAGGTATTQGEPSAVTVEERGAGESQALGDEGATALGVPEGTVYQGDPLANPVSPLANKVFYFKFDSSEIQEDDRPSAEAHGGYLAKHPDVTVILEGHTDERGSREYNLALGERRADSVRRLILLMGASEDQVRVVSYGEERPAVDGHDEGAWQLNRRVEIIYPGK
ncbi:MAG: peptidoglycan-associated lipoprotein Pal [Candidatus Nitrosoglobus sp.]|jgi:peptidoglycan-associated lipoprotein